MTRSPGELLRYGDGQADVIDTLPMYPDVHRKVVRLLAEISPQHLAAGLAATPGRDRQGGLG